MASTATESSVGELTDQTPSTLAVDDHQTAAAVIEPAAPQEPPASSVDTPPPADPLEANLDGVHIPETGERPSRPPPGADRRGLRIVSSRGHNPFPPIPESPESQTRSPTRSCSGMAAATASRHSLAMLSAEPPDSPQRQSSLRAEGEGRGGLTAASVAASALAAASASAPALTAASASAYARVTDATVGGRPPVAKGARAIDTEARLCDTIWPDEMAGGGPAARKNADEDCFSGEEAAELLRMVEAAFFGSLAHSLHPFAPPCDPCDPVHALCNPLHPAGNPVHAVPQVDEAFFSKRGNADGAAGVPATDVAAANVLISDAAASSAAAEAGGELLLSSSVTPRRVANANAERPQLDAGAAWVDAPLGSARLRRRLAAASGHTAPAGFPKHREAVGGLTLPVNGGRPTGRPAIASGARASRPRSHRSHHTDRRWTIHLALVHSSLQPRALQPATPCTPACDPMRSRRREWP